MKKIQTLSGLKKIVSRLQKQNKKVVFTNGCFDIIHPGHIKTLTLARKKGDILIVGLNSDASIKRIKGPDRPIFDQNARASVLAALETVDYLTIFSEDTPYNTIKTLKPDYLVKGGDWKDNQIIGKEFVKKVFRVDLYPGYSTTGAIKKIKKT